MGIYLGPFRFTKRGVRVRIGPRAARLHIGAGGTGLSTGAGPFTWYQPLGGKRRRRPPGRRRAQPRSYASPPPAQQPENTAPDPSGYGRTVQPPLSSAHDPRFPAPPPGYQQRPPRPPGRVPWRDWSGRRRGLTLVGVLATLIVLGIIASATSSPPSTPVSHHNPVPLATSSSPAATSPATVASSPAAAVTTPAQQPTTTQPVTTQPAPAPPPAPTGCYPKTPSGNCYEPGEYCPTADAGMTGLAGDGETIVCTLESGRYHWHPTS